MLNASHLVEKFTDFETFRKETTLYKTAHSAFVSETDEPICHPLILNFMICLDIIIPLHTDVVHD